MRSENIAGTDSANPYYGVPADVVADWIWSIDVTANTRDKYARCFKQFCGYLELMGIDFDAVSKRDILAFKEYLAEDRHLSANTVSLYIQSVKSFYRYAEDQGLPNPASGIRGGHRSTEFKRDILSEAEVGELIDSFPLDSEKSYRDRAIVSLMLHTGVRVVECSRLDVGDISWSNGRHVVRVEGKGRTGDPMLIVLSPACYGHISDYLRQRGNPRRDAPLFVSVSDYNRGERLGTTAITRLVKKSLRSVGLDSSRLTAHSLRHTSASIAVRAGVSIEQVQALLRHADISTTKMYLHLGDRLENPAEDAISGILD